MKTHLKISSVLLLALLGFVFTLVFVKVLIEVAGPRIVNWKLEQLLTANNFKLKERARYTFKDWGLHFESIAIADANFSLEVKGLGINNASHDRLEPFVDIHAMTVRMQPVAMSTKLTQTNANNNTASWQQAADMLRQFLPSIPMAGNIESLTICESQCRQFGAFWKVENSVLKVDLVMFDGSSQAELTLGVNRILLEASLSQPILASFNITLNLSNEPNVAISGRGTFFSSSRMFSLLPETGSKEGALVSNSNLEVEGHVPFNSKVIDLIENLDITVMARSNVNMWLSRPDLKIGLAEQAGQPFDVSGRLKNGLMSVLLESDINTQITSEIISNGQALVPHGAVCTYRLKLKCDIPLLSVTTNVSGYDYLSILRQTTLQLDVNSWSLSSNLEGTISDNEGIEILSIEFDHVTANKHKIVFREGKLNALSMRGTAQNKMALNGSHDLRLQKGQLNLNISQPMSELMPLIQYFNVQNIEMASGKLNADIMLTWQLDKPKPIIDLSMSVAISNFSGRYDAYKLIDGDLNVDLSGWPILQTRRPLYASWDNLDIGIPISLGQFSGNMEVDYHKRILKLEDVKLEAGILGGSLKINSFGMLLNSLKGTENIGLNGGGILSFENLSLNEILRLEKEGFESSGALSGSVPVQITDGTLTITDGVMAAIKPGGFIRYLPPSSVLGTVSKNTSLQVVVDVMSDFQYNALDISLNYQDDGLLIAKTSLIGHNPLYENGREIHLNLNLEENVNTLLESLRLSEKLANRIDKKAQESIDND